MLFFRRCFFLSVSGEEEPISLVEEELDTPSTAESGEMNADRYQDVPRYIFKRFIDFKSFLTHQYSEHG